MRDLPERRWRVVARIAAVAWLMLLAPAELATTLARLTSSATVPPGLVAAALVGVRVLVTAGGFMLGRQLASRTPGVRTAALAWAAADLGTLAVALASARLPTSRAPGDGPIVWGVYAFAALVVVVAASPSPQPERTS
jgi:hypothetical protein